MTLTTIAPTFAQQAQSGSQAGAPGSAGITGQTPTGGTSAPAPILANWQAGPNAVGASTYIGRVETPRVGQIVNTGNGVLISGWAADTTAQGWSGIDGVQIWMGAMGSGTQLGTASVGLSRPDIADSIGGNFTNSGFSGVVPSSVLSTLPAGNVNLRLYIHTPNKGWWYRQSTVTAVQPPVLPYPNDPVVYIAKPQNGMNFTQRQLANRAVFSGVALDRNPLSSVANSLSLLPPGVGQTLALNGCPGCLGATNYIYTQFRGAGIATISAYVDAPSKSGDLSAPGYFGGTQSASPTQGVVILANNAGFLNRSGKPQGSIIQDGFGPDFRFGGWVLTLNLSTISPGSHTLYVTAYSSVTGKSNTAKSEFNVLPFTNSSQKIQP